MTTKKRFFAGLVLALSLPLTACDSDTASATPDAKVITDIDAGADAATATGDAGCIDHPTTHAQIINACTDAVKIHKKPVLPLLNADGTLPPLP